MAKFPFLSDEWMSAAKEIVDRHNTDTPPTTEIQVNLVVTETPFDKDVEMHMGAKDGKGEWGPGHTDAPDVTLTTDYETAKQIFVSGDPQAGMQAFMQGKVRAQGDMSKLMMTQAQGGGAAGNPALAKDLQEITE